MSIIIYICDGNIDEIYRKFIERFGFLLNFFVEMNIHICPILDSIYFI